MERRHFLAALSSVYGLRYADIAMLDLNSAYSCSEGDFLALGLSTRVSQNAIQAIRKFNAASWEQKLYSAKCQAIPIGEPGYPKGLCEIHFPPLILYARGAIGTQEKVAIVGTRQATYYGRQAVETFVPPLVAAAHTIVSGLALGIDTYAHQATMKLGGHTIAVLGTGVDHIYPRENRLLAERIIENGGALCSEYLPGTPPARHHFPARNRIISGLSKACIVVEGDLTSGALITATHALEQGREVMAVPGSIFSLQSRGPNYLISQGAVPLSNPTVLAETLHIGATRVVSEKIEETPQSRLLLAALGASALTPDELVVSLAMSTPTVLAMLSELEILGTISRLPTGQYICHNPRA